jgi:CRISPR type III-A-associated protein Csm2
MEGLLTKQSLKEWIEKGADLSLMKELKGNIEKKDFSQGMVRKFYQQVVHFTSQLASWNRSKEDLFQMLLKLYVLVSYERGRDNRDVTLLSTIESAIEILDEKVRNAKEEEEWRRYYERFAFLLESIVAFHKEAAYVKKALGFR